MIVYILDALLNAAGKKTHNKNQTPNKQSIRPKGNERNGYIRTY